MTARALIKRLTPKPILRARSLHRHHAFTRTPSRAFQWLLRGRELHNFTYDIGNRVELASFVARAANCSDETAQAYIRELDEDVDLRSALRRSLATRRDRPNHMPYGRRLGWYALTRALRPSLVVETGVHDGLGSAVFLRALERNAAEGNDGRLLAFDIGAGSGWLVPKHLRTRYELIIGDALSDLDGAVAGRTVDLFLHDSDHAYEHETAELEKIHEHLSPGSVLLSDNSHAVPALSDFCRRRGYAYTFFREAPVDHWYPGDGIGLAVVPPIR